MRSSKPKASAGSMLMMFFVFLAIYFLLVGCRRQLDDMVSNPAIIYIDGNRYEVSQYWETMNCVNMRLKRGGEISKCNYKSKQICNLKK